MARPLLALIGLLLAGCAKDGPRDSAGTATGAPLTGTTSLPPAVCGAGLAAVNGPKSYGTVGEALSDASQDDTVVICAGTWQVEGSVGTGTVTIRGETGNPADVVLTPSAAGGTVLRFSSSTRIRVEHLTLTGATTSAISVSTVSDMTVDNCIFTDNTGDLGGGAIAAQVSRDPLVPKNLRISNSRFTGNTAPQGGAIELIARGGASLWIEDSQFDGNQADTGGAIYTLPIEGSGNGLFVENCTFDTNDASRDGGAVAFTGPGTIRWTDTTATGNTAGNAGAAYALLPPANGDGSTAILERGRIAENAAGGVLSGAVHLEPGWTLEATNTDFASGTEDNTPKDVNVCGDVDDVDSFTVGPSGCQGVGTP